MTELSRRLQKIADRIDNGKTMADIGTDHGFLPIYLIENDISPFVVMTDVSRPSLMKGSENLDMLGADRSRARFRVGDGISVLDIGEVDTVVIAGMGGMLIRDIMSADFELTCSFRKYILQPRKRQGHLRKWLLENGFTIIHEDLVEEGRFIPEIITALSPKAADDAEAENPETEEIAAEEPASEKSAAGEAGTKEPGAGTDCRNTDSLQLCIKGTAFASPDDTGEDIIYRVPPWITQASGPVEDFLVKNITSEQEKLENVMLAKERNMRLEDRICRGIRYLRDLLEEYRNGR